MQEQLNDKTVVLSVKGAKITGRPLAKAMQAFLKKAREPTYKKGNQSIKSLAKQGASLSNIEITGDNTGSFKRTARKDCIFYTDSQSAFADILPPKRHVIGKSGTIAIGQDNSNTLYYPGRFTNRTKVVSKKKEMVDTNIKLWLALSTSEILAHFKDVALSIRENSRF